MSLVRTLGKVAMGIIVAKGVERITGRRRGGSGLGGLISGLMGGNNSSSGGISNLLKGLSGKGGGGGLGSILNSFSGETQNNKNANSESRSKNDFGNLFNDTLQGKEAQASEDDEKKAEIILRAMIHAAKADGHLDDEEKRKITEHLDDISEEEANFVRQELQAPLDTQGLIKSIPKGMEEQVYLMSLLVINLDSKEEAQYLDQLAKGLNISPQVSNQIHEKLGALQLYS